METNFCQSCAMPLTKIEEMGTEQDGTHNTDYCVFCYKNGAFTQDVTMEQMIDICAQYLDEYNKDAPEKLTLDQAKVQMREYFPQLKRWKNA